MILPARAKNFAEALRRARRFSIRSKCVEEKKDLIQMSAMKEGSLRISAPSKKLLSIFWKATLQAGYKAGEDILLGLDCASSEMWRGNGKYELYKSTKKNSDARADGEANSRSC